MSGFGVSTAEVRFPDQTEDNVLTGANRVFGRSVTAADIASAVGAPDNARVEVRLKGQGDTERLRVTYSGEDHEAKRTIRRGEDGKLIVQNESFYVNSESQGNGLGTAVFGRQVEQASKLGVDRLEAFAIRSDEATGYYVWPRFGYDAPITDTTRSRIADGEIPPMPLAANRISDLMQNPEGRSWWKQHAGSVEVTFDLAPGSINRQIWDRYLSEKSRTGR